MRNVLMVILIFLYVVAGAQSSQLTTEQIRQQMAKIRQTTNWNDPVAAKKANEQIQKLAQQLNGGKQLPVTFGKKEESKDKSKSVEGKVVVQPTKENVVKIADRFYKKTYKQLAATEKTIFDLDLKQIESTKNSFKSVRNLSSIGGEYLNLSNNPDIACVYLASALEANPSDTLCVNNFGAYLRMIDSTNVALTVLLYANSIFDKSPIILTQLGHCYLELNDFIKAEKYYREALKYNPRFGQTHSALCNLYLELGRWKEALQELFAGIVNGGFTYMDGASNLQRLTDSSSSSSNSSANNRLKISAVVQQNNSNSGDDATGESNEIQIDMKDMLASLVPPEKTLTDDDKLAPLVPQDNRIQMPKFPECKRVEDWQEGGGYEGAISAWQNFVNYDTNFIKEFNQINDDIPQLPENAVLRDYPNERLALDCITEQIYSMSVDIDKKYRTLINKIEQTVNTANEKYLQTNSVLSQKYASCIESCGDEYCLKKCQYEFCQKECPNANKYNDILRHSFLDWQTAFFNMKNEQEKLLDDLYGFTEPWMNRLSSPYWSRIYAYEVRRVALGIIGNCYGNYPQLFQQLAHNICVNDCSVYANPFPERPSEVRQKSPEANQCPNIGKIKISLDKCDLSLDCESIEFGCVAGIAASIKRNFVKKTTTGFLGVGIKGSAGFISAGVKAGIEVTVTDNNEVEDVGGKFDVSTSFGPGVTKAGASTSGSCTVMTGLKAKTGFSVGGKAF